QRLGESPRYICVSADIYKLPFVSDLFDGATMIRTLHHMTQPDLALQSVWQVLSENAVPVPVGHSQCLQHPCGQVSPASAAVPVLYGMRLYYSQSGDHLAGQDRVVEGTWVQVDDLLCHPSC
ncbi:MAG: class I SAM-dependent methyltransferase, partial [Anaerolineaceae bacterium]